LLITVILPARLRFFPSGTTTDNSTVIASSSGVKLSPFIDVKVQSPQSGHSLIYHSSSEDGAPMFSTVKLPVTVLPGLALDHIRFPSQFKKVGNTETQATSE
jgi:hypothetical protein